MLDMHTRPSDLIGIEDTYSAFCFDEACAYILKELKDGKEPVFKNKLSDSFKVKKPSDLYSKFER